MVFKPTVLIISNKHDYSTDHVVYQLEKLNIKYLRLNRDQFSEYELILDPINRKFYGKTKVLEFEIDEVNLKSIYFRAPIYLRINQNKDLSIDENLSRNQWVSFLRSLMIFENVLWVNHPQATFLSETKPFQLKVANELDFNIPNTLISNTNNISDFSDKVAFKTLDPAIFPVGDKQSFIYTNFLNFNELNNYDLSDVPIIIQNALVPKIDIRVTVVKDYVFAVSIKYLNKGINNDWRLQKDNLNYELIDLPQDIIDKCIKLLDKLKLKFGCIDLVVFDGEYYFIEINPTGEWDWLMHDLNLDIDVKIANLLING